MVAVEKLARLQTDVNELTEKLQHKVQEVADHKTFVASMQVLAFRRQSPFSAGLDTGAFVLLI
jgi:FtsZ-binding cell division protein ZapB